MNYHIPLLPNRIYHVFNHAVGIENLFREEKNYFYFLELVQKYVLPITNIYAFNLLPNHFHFLVHIKSEDDLKEVLKNKSMLVNLPDYSKLIMQQFSNCFNAYAKAFNKLYERKGALFIDYMKRSEIRSESYFQNCLHYIHYNAVRHGLCESIDDWYWSSYQAFIVEKPSKLARKAVMDVFSDKTYFIQFHQQKPILEEQEMEFGII